MICYLSFCKTFVQIFCLNLRDLASKKTLCYQRAYKIDHKYRVISEFCLKKGNLLTSDFYKRRA